MKTLKITAKYQYGQETFLFRVLVPGRKFASTCVLRDCDGKLEICQSATVLADFETPDEKAVREALNASEPMIAGESVLVDGDVYIVRIRGDYSDLGYLVRA